MTEKRFKFDNEVGFIDNQKCGGDIINNKEIVDLLNQLSNENENNKKLIKYAYDDNDRLRNKNERLHKDWDKLYELCREHLTDEEIIKELGR